MQAISNGGDRVRAWTRIADGRLRFREAFLANITVLSSAGSTEEGNVFKLEAKSFKKFLTSSKMGGTPATKSELWSLCIDLKPDDQQILFGPTGATAFKFLVSSDYVTLLTVWFCYRGVSYFYAWAVRLCL
jgi:hypothetical protein